MFLYFRMRSDVRQERRQDEMQEVINKIDDEIERFETLLHTDPQLKEYARP